MTKFILPVECSLRFKIQLNDRDLKEIQTYLTQNVFNVTYDKIQFFGPEVLNLDDFNDDLIEIGNYCYFRTPRVRILGNVLCYIGKVKNDGYFYPERSCRYVFRQQHSPTKILITKPEERRVKNYNQLISINCPIKCVKKR